MYSNESYVIELLQEALFVTPEQVAEIEGSKRSNLTLVESLIDRGIVSETDVAGVVANAASMNLVDLSHHSVDPSAVEAVPAETAIRYKVAPVGFDAGRLVIAVGDPLNFETLDSIPHVIAHDFQFVCGVPSQIEEMLTTHYGDADRAARILEERLGASFDSGGEEGDDASVSDDDAPIIRLVSTTLMEAFKARASDIHIEPLEKDMRIRFRIDGKLHDVEHHPKKLHPAVMTRLKIMTGSMSIDEKRVPQDGRIQMRLADRDLDLRVSTVPTNHGESVVMRILDKQNLKIGLSDLGFFSDDQEAFESLLQLPDGILLVTGPTGSGKTTTLYACLNFINKPDRKIITVEDPVEYELSGINQVGVKESIGMSFAAALRAILRQAPNIIMIGEIRDLETASIAINASLTGHLVFSTLHTNDAPSAVARLTDIGIKPFLISSAVRAIMAQRLTRKLCPECKQPATLEEKEMRALNIDADSLLDSTIMGPGGCGKCRTTGFRGRMALIEMFGIDDEVRDMVNEKLSTPQLRKRARQLGMRTLREDGVRKVLAGLTTAKEVMHITMGDSD